MMEPEPARPGGSTPGRTCPWCSSENDDDATTCRSCGAALIALSRDAAIPGVTIVDPVAATEAADADLGTETARDIAIETALHTVTHPL